MQRFTPYMLVLAVACAAISCNSSSSGAAFAGAAGAGTAEGVAETYSQIASAPGAGVTVQGLSKLKLNNLCLLLEKAADNDLVVLTPSKWRLTRSFMIAHAAEMNYFCTQYTSLGDLLSAINLDPKEIHKEDLKDSIQNAADVLNGANINAGPKKVLSTTLKGQCDTLNGKSKVSMVGASSDQKTQKAATNGMQACGPAAVVGILLLDKQASSLNNDLTAASVACMALYGYLLKKTSVSLPTAAGAGPTGGESKDCKAADAKKKAAATPSDGGGDSSGGDGSTDDSGG